MDAIKAEIARQRKLLEEKSQQNSNKRSFFMTELVTINSNYKNHVKQAKLDDSISESNPSTDSVQKATSPVKIDESNKLEECKLKRSEVIRRLREKSQPIRLFGESDFEVYQRFKRLQLHEPEEKGLGSDFKAAMDKVQQAYLQEVFHQNADLLVRSNSGGDSSNNNNGDVQTIGSLEVNIKSDDLNEAQINLMKDELLSYVAERMSAASKKSSTLKGLDDRISTFCDHVLRFLKHILCVWGRELNARSKEEKQSFHGRRSSATYTQTVEYIKPLLKKMKNHDISFDILDSLVKIISFLLDRNYIKANDAYLELAIGNAPWPLGVTNHGIHCRTAQEKIHAKNVAHVLNDETQRKYIQAMKRLMTHCQRIYPTNPSRCVNYMGES